ncbi:MAG: TonB-dependent receptor [Pseudomonadota bacterium]
MKTNITTIFRRKSLLLSVIAAMSAAPGQFAQAADDDLEEIKITGSRIRQTSGMVTPVPITAVTMDELANFEPDATLAEQLDQLPQFYQTSSAQRGGVISGTSGASTLNMRGIGSNRTLILLDGSRVVPNDRTGVVNVDVFPTALISNIEVVTGGASAAYGADALAGVVNFILDREFEGLKTSVSSGITEQGDGQNWNASIAGGRQFDRLHLIGSIEGGRTHQIDRDITAVSGQMDSFRRWGHVTNPAWQAASALPVGNPDRCVTGVLCSAGPQRLTLPDVHSTVSTPTGLIALPAAGTTPASALNRLTFLEDGSGVRPFVNGDVFLANPTAGLQSQAGGPEALLADLSFNPGGTGNEVRQEALFTGFKFDVSDRFNIHGDMIISNTESNTHNQQGYPHLQGGQANWQATIYSGNPFLPASVQQIMTAENRPFIRVDKLGQPLGITDFDSYESQHNLFATWTGNVGFDLDLNDNWQLSGHYQSGETDRTTIIYNEVRLDRLFLAIDAVRDANGAIVCNVQKVNPTAAQLQAAVAGRTFNGQQPKPITRTSPIGGDNTIRDCVPLNILGVGNSSQAARNYVHDDRIAHTNVQQDFAELVVDGELFDGFGAGPVSMAAGLTWRDSSFEQYYETTSGDPLDGPPVNAEALGIRGIPTGYAAASTSMFMFGGVPNISGEYDVWEIFSELNVPVWESASGNQRLEFNFAGRNADYSRSGEIVSWKAGTSFQVTEDLRLRGTLSKDVREPSFAELFDQQGTAASVIDAAFTPPKSSQLTIVNGGNPDLSPEEADTTTVGLVYQPTFDNWLDGFQVSLDWYEIDIEGLIGSLGAQRLVDDCLKGSALACGYVERDAVTNDVIRVSNIFLNINAATVSGVDAEVIYRMEPDFFSSEAENLSIRALIGYMAENSQTSLGAAKFEQAGGPGRPEWSSTVTATYGLGAFDVSLRANYFDSVLVNAMWTEGVEVDDNGTASSTIWNLGVGYNGETSSGSSWRTTFNVTNLFDREPPVIASFSTRFGTQTLSNDYDVFGRKYQLSFNYDF